MLTFKQFLLVEMPHKVDYVPKNVDNDDHRPWSIPESHLDKPISVVASGFSHQNDGKPISHLPNGYEVHKVLKKPKSRIGEYHIVNSETKKVAATLAGDFKKKGKEFHISWAAKHSSYKHPMSDLHAHLAIHHGLEIHSSHEHSPGTVHTYKQLSQNPKLNITRDRDRLPIHSGDDFDKNYEQPYKPPSKFIIKKKE